MSLLELLPPQRPTVAVQAPPPVGAAAPPPTGGLAELLDRRAQERDALYWPAGFPDHLSPSSIAKAGCPEAWRRRYLLGQRERSSSNMVIGVSVHGYAELNYAQKIHSGEDVPLTTALELAAVAFDEKVEKDEEELGVDWGDTTPGEAKDLAVKLADAYHRFAAPQVTPVAAEENLEAQLAGVPVVIVGRVDIRTDMAVVDIKTTKAKTARPKGEWRLKGMVYAALTGLGVEWHNVSKAKTPGVYTPENEPGLWMPPTPALLGVAHRRVIALVETLIDLHDRYGPDEPWPTTATEHDWKCNYCGFRPNCTWWAE